MNLVFQCRLTDVEVGACERESRILDEIEIAVTVTMETAQQNCDKVIKGEITDAAGQRVLRRVPA